MTTSSSNSMMNLITITLLILINLLPSARAQPRVCTTNGGYTDSSTYAVTLNAITPTLAVNIETDRSFVYAVSVAAIPSRETLNALASCRGDTTPDQCGTCVETGTTALLQLCLNQRQGVIWYDSCIVRYSDIPLNMSNTAQFILRNGNAAPSRDRFKRDRDALLVELTTIAVNGGSRLKLGAGSRATSAAGAGAQAIYGLVQCTANLSPPECRRCLEEAAGALRRCCDFDVGVRILKADCTVQYELNIFYNATRLRELGVLLT